MSTSLDLKRGFIRDEIEIFAEDMDLNLDYGFMHWFYKLIFDLEEDDLIPDDENTDGKGDKQIDFFRVDIDDTEQSATITIAQVKNTTGFSSNTVSLMKLASILFLRKSVQKLKS